MKSHDRLSKRRILSLTDRKIKIKTFMKLSSTNAYLKREARRGREEGFTVIAQRQTGGYGRYGRSFYSPSGTGLYMSILLKPKMSCDSSLLITTAAAVAVSEAIQTVTGKNALIKWVNDIYIGDKKVCGILTEAGYDGSGVLSYAVLGIGINLYSPKDGFPEGLSEIAGYILDEKTKDGMSRLSAEIINRFFDYYEELEAKPHLSAYRSRLNLVGRRIKVISAGGEKEAVCRGVNDDFALLTELEGGELEALSSGEVSTRIIKG